MRKIGSFLVLFESSGRRKSGRSSSEAAAAAAAAAAVAIFSSIQKHHIHIEVCIPYPHATGKRELIPVKDKGSAGSVPGVLASATKPGRLTSSRSSGRRSAGVEMMVSLSRYLRCFSKKEMERTTGTLQSSDVAVSSSLLANRRIRGVLLCSLSSRSDTPNISLAFDMSRSMTLVW